MILLLPFLQVQAVLLDPCLPRSLRADQKPRLLTLLLSLEMCFVDQDSTEGRKPERDRERWTLFRMMPLRFGPSSRVLGFKPLVYLDDCCCWFFSVSISLSEPGVEPSDCFLFLT